MASPTVCPRTRLLTLLALLIGAALLFYGAAAHRVPVRKAPTPDQTDTDRAAAPDSLLLLSEFALTRDVAVGGVIRQPAGDLQRTYSGSAPPANACPT